MVDITIVFMGFINQQTYLKSDKLTHVDRFVYSRIVIPKIIYLSVMKNLTGRWEIFVEMDVYSSENHL